MPGMGEMPRRFPVDQLTAEFAVHTWDLARATGQDERLDERCVAACAEQLPQFGGTLLRLGGFSAVPPAADADAQTAFLNAVGRHTWLLPGPVPVHAFQAFTST